MLGLKYVRPGFLDCWSIFHFCIMQNIWRSAQYIIAMRFRSSCFCSISFLQHNWNFEIISIFSYTTVRLQMDVENRCPCKHSLVVVSSWEIELNGLNISIILLNALVSHQHMKKLKNSKYSNIENIKHKYLLLICHAKWEFYKHNILQEVHTQWLKQLLN